MVDIVIVVGIEAITDRDVKIKLIRVGKWKTFKEIFEDCVKKYDILVDIKNVKC